MEIDVRIDRDEAVVAVSGQLVQGERLALLREKVNALIREGYRKVVIDLNSVSYVDSVGLGELVALHASCQREGTVLRFGGLSKRLADLLAISKLLDIFELEPPRVADPLNPTLRDHGRELWVAIALAILVIIGVMIVLK